MTRKSYARSRGSAGSMGKRPGLGLTAVAVTVMLWSASNVVVKGMSLTGLTVSFYRLWFAIAVLWTLVAFTPSLHRRLNRDWLLGSLGGGFFFGLHQILFFVSLKATSVANVLIVAALQPVLVLLVSGWLFGERARLGGFVWASVAILGISMVMMGATGAPHWSAFGDFLAVLNLFAFTAYFLVSKRTRERVGAFEYTVGITTVAGLIVGLAALLAGEDLSSPSGIHWIILPTIAILPGTTGHFLLNWAHAHTSAFVVSIAVLGVPVLATTGAYLFLAETLTLWQMVGGAVVLLAIGMVVSQKEGGGEDG